MFCLIYLFKAQISKVAATQAACLQNLPRNLITQVFKNRIDVF